MADSKETETKKAKKPDRPDKAERPDKGGEGKKADAKKGDAKKGGDPKKGEAGKAEKKPRAPEERVIPRMRTFYDEVVRAKLTEQFGYANKMQVPRVDKIVLNMGIGEGVADRKKVENAATDLALIAGQKPVITKARKSIANFKLRDGQAIGCKVTLRKTRMYEFIDRLVTIALPRVRDFRGLAASSFDGRGNYTIGIKEHIVFPEIDYDKAESIWGMDITVCTTAKSDDEARALLSALNFPFRQ